MNINLLVHTIKTILKYKNVIILIGIFIPLKYLVITIHAIHTYLFGRPSIKSLQNLLKFKTHQTTA